MLVGGIVVDDGVDRLSLRHLRFDGVEEAYKLLKPMALHVALIDTAINSMDLHRGQAISGYMPSQGVRALLIKKAGPTRIGSPICSFCSALHENPL